MDLRGHGRSARAASYLFGEFGDDILGLCEDLDFDRVDLVGHSLGGHAVSLVAQQQPELVRRLVLEEAPLPLRPGDPVPNFAGRLPSLVHAVDRDAAGRDHRELGHRSRRQVQQPLDDLSREVPARGVERRTVDAHAVGQIGVVAAEQDVAAPLVAVDTAVAHGVTEGHQHLPGPVVPHDPEVGAGDAEAVDRVVRAARPRHHLECLGGAGQHR
ncbi:alpha/beta fold hydrolase [Rhodococcus hoagii]|nr:alpha/beta fold hydrolase [Prescottella equi]